MAQTVFRKRHDKVAQPVHWNLCKKYRLDHAGNWYIHNETVLFDFTDRQFRQVMSLKLEDLTSQ